MKREFFWVWVVAILVASSGLIGKTATATKSGVTCQNIDSRIVQAKKENDSQGVIKGLLLDYKRLCLDIERADKQIASLEKISGNLPWEKISELLISDGWTLIDLPYSDLVECLPYFEKKGFSINMKDELGDTPLIKAAEGGKAKMVKALIQRGADCNLSNEFSKRPIDYAVVAGKSGRETVQTPQKMQDYLQTVKYLVEGGADFEHSLKGDTPIEGAKWYRNQEIVDYLEKQLVQKRAQK